ncbi:hypothetical protein [Halorussus caseinilyticus]|uniref:Uncharacterized protein n=1 Tax=Halorussus caseinilyticus TaxID=3034025 RepID=A0ABD5WEE4_9EURY|nr:hypothetical protein [Halorussus sp. DT72]
MARTAYLTSALVTGVVLLAVWVAVARMEEWRHYDRSASETPARPGETGASESVGAWVAGFLLLVLVAGGGAVLLVSDPAVASAVGSWVALAVVFAVVLVGFLLWGTYSSARFRGLRSAQAALLSAWLFGSLFVAAVAVKLVLAG